MRNLQNNDFWNGNGLKHNLQVTRSAANIDLTTYKTYNSSLLVKLGYKDIRLSVKDFKASAFVEGCFLHTQQRKAYLGIPASTLDFLRNNKKTL